ncbi:MAG TPA: hypothetical protein VMW66_01285, partial [Elusimicrobiales bacterium]|nr:hypothetical protein [Elusimicrobiales bacterium]
LQGVISQQLVCSASNTGRVLASEVLIATSAIRNLIRDYKVEQIVTAMQTGAKYGMVTMNQSLADLYTKQLITYQEAISRATDVDDLKKYLQKGK